MQVYFVKATYTNNVYKLSDFFLSGDYKKDPNKMLDINFIANDDQTFIKGTRKLELPDGSSIREYTHIIVPDYNKIYKITDIVYLNVSQANINLEEDPMIGNYLDLESKNIILRRSNDVSLFRGVNDISDLALKETVETDVISPDIKSGKWALLFFQFNNDVATAGMRIGLNFTKDTPTFKIYANSFAELKSNYPEVSTDQPETVEYYQEQAFAILENQYYQCNYNNNLGKLVWTINPQTDSDTYYFDARRNADPAKINETDVLTVCVALPFETTIYESGGLNKYFLSYEKFVGPIGSGELIDIKIINDLILPKDSVVETYNATTGAFTKEITFKSLQAQTTAAFTDSSLSVISQKRILFLKSFESDIDISLSVGTITPKNAEPFKKYELYVFGQKIIVPYYLASSVRLLIAMNSGIINFVVYYQNKRNILANGTFTHAIRYQVDQLDQFYNQNPTYKDQFYLKLGGNAFRTVAGGAVAGAAIGGVNAITGAGAGLLSTGLDAGLAIANLHYMEKGLMLQPDQIFGDNGDVTLQAINVFGIYWVTKTPENIDLLEQEYSLRGFPTALSKKITDLTYATSALFGTSKVIFGEIKDVVRNQYATNAINEKLKQGVVLVP